VWPEVGPRCARGGVGEADQIGLDGGEGVVRLEQHDRHLCNARGHLGRKSRAERSGRLRLTEHDGVGTVGADGDGGGAGTGRHRDNRNRPAELALELVRQPQGEGTALASRRPPRERDDLARPRCRVLHGGLQPPGEECGDALVQLRMQVQQALDVAARQDEQHGIEGDANREGAPLTGEQCAL
jgi:hypothetical protein